MKTLITGVAGFIGMHSALRLLDGGGEVIGVDNLNEYYDVNLKRDRLSKLQKYQNFTLHNIDINDSKKVDDLFFATQPSRVINLAAEVGVRNSVINPHAYVETNIKGFMNVLEGCRKLAVDHFIYASSSSVYGANKLFPFSEHHNVDHPLNLYAASKKANELMAHAYSNLYNLPTTGLRFFTVYGPWGRPDMALFKFAAAMLRGEPIDIYNNGEMVRDFTYVDDIVEGIFRVVNKVATPNERDAQTQLDPSTSNVPYRIFNIGNGRPAQLMDYVKALEVALDIKAKKNFLPMQLGEIRVTSADTYKLNEWINFQPKTTVSEGVQKFADWFVNHYGRN